MSLPALDPPPDLYPPDLYPPDLYPPDLYPPDLYPGMPGPVPAGPVPVGPEPLDLGLPLVFMSLRESPPLGPVLDLVPFLSWKG